MKDTFVAIHGHFYQPPRENPWLEAIETEESAHPFHDWNERITAECYRPNGHARMVDGKGKILDIVNNYTSLSFNFGPTLLSWLEKMVPPVYQKILEADREGMRRFGHGNAIAQVYNHLIMPLANERDKETEVLWGIADFEKRFHRKPQALWLSETAVDYRTLDVLVRFGMKYLLLSPLQALKVRPFGSKRWTDVSQGKIDSTQPYRCFIRDPSGRKMSDRFIDIFFYDGMISKEVGFGDLLNNGDLFCERFARASQTQKKGAQLIHIATDGETYGHHKKFGDMALAYALQKGFASHGLEIITHEAFLKRFPPVVEVEIDEGPQGEGTSWSCAHGVGRWKEDCGCSTGGKPGWNQKWRRPLRQALDFLREEASQIFEREGEGIFNDVWEARNGYIGVILDRSPNGRMKFFETYGRGDLGEKEKGRGLKLLEMQRHALLMYTSCGWFFADLAGLETVQILRYAARAIGLAEELSGQPIEARFLEHLSEAKSNLPERGSGREIYESLVQPRSVPLEKVVNQYAISSIFDGEESERKIYSYRVERQGYEKHELKDRYLVLGQVRVTPEIIPEPKEYLFGLIPSGKEIFRTWISEEKGGPPFETLREKGLEMSGKGEEEMETFLKGLLGGKTYTLRDAFLDERQVILQRLAERELAEHRRMYADLFDRTKKAVEALSDEGLEIPYEIRVAAEVTLSDRLFEEVKALKKDFKGTIERGKIDRIVEEATHHGLRLRRKESETLLNEMLKEGMDLLKKGVSSQWPDQTTPIEGVLLLLDFCEKWRFDIRKEEAQDIMDEILDETLDHLERSWWADGKGKPLPSQMILLAETLGFNVDKFSKIVSKR